MTISAFPHYKLNDIPEGLRQLANRIEHGGVNAVRIVVVIEPDDDRIDYQSLGCEPFTRAHAAGLCFAAAMEIIHGGDA